jgi:hypothetical protein
LYKIYTISKLGEYRPGAEENDSPFIGESVFKGTEGRLSLFFDLLESNKLLWSPKLYKYPFLLLFN